jgi:glycosyltransferase involved in cell wall biosynthesis
MFAPRPIGDRAASVTRCEHGFDLHRKRQAVDPLARISVVIPARNAATTLGAQLEAIGSGAGTEVIVVDNASGDTTAVVASHHGAHVVNCEKVGVNAARNAGVQAATNEKIALCDADDVVAPGWARAMTEALDHYDVVGGRLDLQSLNDERVRRCYRVRDGSAVGLPKGAIIGANMAFRRSAWAAIGGFDEAFAEGYDEVDFVHRSGEAGFRLGHCPDAIVAYRLRGDRRAASSRAVREMLGSAQLRSKHGWTQHWKASAIAAGRHLARAASVWRCMTSVGRWQYRVDCARAHGAWLAWRRFGIVP